MPIILPTPTAVNSGSLTSPGRAPERICGDRGPEYACNRPAGHTGRHSFRWYHLGGVVRAVWS